MIKNKGLIVYVERNKRDLIKRITLVIHLLLTTVITMEQAGCLIASTIQTVARIFNYMVTLNINSIF